MATTHVGLDGKERGKQVHEASPRRSGEKEEGIEVRMRWRSAKGAPDCVGSDMRAHGGGLRACEAYGRAAVEKVRGATEGERIVSGLFTEEFEEVDRLAIGEDVE